VSYGIIAYWCAWMKAYHPLAYGAAVLRNAKDDRQALEMLRELQKSGVQVVPFDPELSEVNWSVKGGRIIGGFLNLDGFGPAKAVDAVERRRLGTWDDKLRERIAAAKIKFLDLYPLRNTYAALIADPEAHGCRPRTRITFTEDLPPEGEVVMILKVMKKETRDDNETVRVARRKGVKRTGPTKFADLWCTDDSGIPVLVRVDRFDYEPVGRRAVERLRPEEDVLLVRGNRLFGYPVLMARKLRCLTAPEALEHD
jgi:hypothetical protein